MQTARTGRDMNERRLSDIEKAFDAVINKVLKRKSALAATIGQMHDLASQHAEFASQVHHGHMRDKKWLQSLVDRLASENRAPLRELPAPVGRTVRLMQIGDKVDGPIIDEPAAEALRSRDFLEIGESKRYDVKIVGVFKTNGTCRVEPQDSKTIVAGKIIDPVVSKPHNVYTNALNDDLVMRVTAKPTFKDGKLQKLFISDAEIKAIPKRRSKKAS